MSGADRHRHYRRAVGNSSPSDSRVHLKSREFFNENVLQFRGICGLTIQKLKKITSVIIKYTKHVIKKILQIVFHHVLILVFYFA